MGGDARGPEAADVGNQGGLAAAPDYRALAGRALTLVMKAGNLASMRIMGEPADPLGIFSHHGFSGKTVADVFEEIAEEYSAIKVAMGQEGSR